MGKKILVLFCFLSSAICLVSAGLYVNRKQAGLTEYIEEPVTKVKSPELLSEINMTSYVSLPASFSDIDIVENLDNIEVTEENVDTVMYDQLFKTANQSTSLDSDGKTMVIDYTVTQDNEVKEVKSNEVMGYDSKSTVYDTTVFKSLKDKEVGSSLHLDDVTSFNGYENVSLDITIKDIYDMPYPVTDNYIKKHTSYTGVSDMRAALINDASGEAKELAREHTISTLMDTMISQATFIKLPESLTMKELEALQKDDPNATYEEAKHSLYKIFFIAAVIDHYDVTTKTDMEKRYAALPESEKEGLSDYEIERKKYLLFEDDVVTCIYKKVVITSQ